MKERRNPRRVVAQDLCVLGGGRGAGLYMNGTRSTSSNDYLEGRYLRMEGPRSVARIIEEVAERW